VRVGTDSSGSRLVKIEARCFCDALVKRGVHGEEGWC